MMNKTEIPYIPLVIFHIILGILVYLIPLVAFGYGLFSFVFGIFYILKTKNKNNEVIYMAAYMVSIEVFLRMSKEIISYDFIKYVVSIYMIIGILLSGIKKQSFIYFVYILLLIPAIIVSTETLEHETDFRKALVFNLLGPICLGISSIYCYQRSLTFQQVLNIICFLGLPIIATLTYMFLYTPDLKESVTGTGSNFATSGGFGPNQVSTILGLGMFVFFVQILLNSRSKIILYINIFLILICSYRAIITFSRGGVITGIIMILIFVYFLFKKLNTKSKNRMLIIIMGTIVIGFSVWSYSSLRTGGMIEKRYANQNASGVEKEGLLTGRETLMETEFQMFLDNPIFGVGVGKNREERIEMTGIEAASHNEITRLLAEHGIFGIFALLILIFTPLSLYPVNQQNIFLLSFFIFWALTINHAAMRLAAPAFIYALSLLKVTFDENPSLHREQAIETRF